MAHQALLIFENELTPKGGAKIPFGIHTGCKVTSIDYKPGEFIDINFEDGEGRFHNKRLWQPHGKFPREVKLNDGTTVTETPAQALQREETENLAHLAKLMHIFKGKDASKAEVATWPEMEYDPMAKKMIASVEPLLSSSKVNLKLIYDSEGIYSTFGKYPDYIEQYVEGEPCGLAYTPYEKKNRCTYQGGKDDGEKDASNEEALNALFKNKA